MALDGLVHGWDIATATGQPYDPARRRRRRRRRVHPPAISEDMRGEAFAAAADPPAGASPLVKLIAFTGRHV